MAGLAVSAVELLGRSAGSPAGDPAPGASPERARRHLAVDPAGFISRERLLATLGELTAIGATSLWRNSASRGEAEALELVTARLAVLGFLQGQGIELERQHFRTYIATQARQARLVLRVGGQDVEVPAHALQGNRENLAMALNFDSDGGLNDDDPDPVEVDGSIVVLRSVAELDALAPGSLSGRIALVDYALLDRSIQTSDIGAGNAGMVLNAEPAGLVLVTTFSNQKGVSHGTFVGDLSVLVSLPTGGIPVVYARMEDLGGAGISSWGDLGSVQSARLTWDADIFSPGHSSNLIVRVPGVDPTRAVILGAHIDSPNSPGALDNGSGSVVLLEVARALDAARARPPVDLYLCWFGSHERGLYGSSNFVASHSELLDRTVAMLQTDCLSRPLDGIEGHLYAETWPYGRFGNPSLTWPNAVAQAAGRRGIDVRPLAVYGLVSDNSSFGGYDVPNANFIFMNPFEMEEVHYEGHLHDPYDTVELAREEAATLESMARVALTAALDAGHSTASLRVTPPPDRRALFVASHTEAPHMTPTSLTEFSMALAWEGIDVDVVPFGTAVVAGDLDDTDMVVALPVHDYPSVVGDMGLYDEAWTAGEVDALQAYVQDGGLLVVTGSWNRLKYVNQVLEPNEDWSDVNQLSARFGVNFVSGPIAGTTARPSLTHVLTSGVSSLFLAQNNGVRYTVASGQVLFRVGTEPVVTLVSVGSHGGQVLVLADLGLLGSSGAQPQNLPFWRNLARYARSRSGARSGGLLSLVPASEAALVGPISRAVAPFLASGDERIVAPPGRPRRP